MLLVNIRATEAVVLGSLFWPRLWLGVEVIPALGVPHKWHTKTERKRNQETEEGARGSSAVRQ